MNDGMSQVREYSLDNIRFLLIFSVVLGHLLEISTPFPGKEMIYKLIYSFHMPVFLFLFGYLAKFSPKRIVCRWCFPYVIFQCLYLLFANYILNTNAVFRFTTPYWILWYLLVCIYYQLLLPLFDVDNKYRQILTLLSVFLISFLVGKVNFVGYRMALSRFFVFQPWFVLGYYCRKNDLPNRLLAFGKLRVALLLAAAAVMILLVPCLIMIPDKLLYGSYSYANCGGSPWMRGVMWLISLAMLLILFVWCRPYLNIELYLITHIGQNTLPVFILHGFLVKALGLYFPTLINSFWQTLLLSCAIVLLTGNKLCRKVVSWVSFSWLEKYEVKFDTERS